MTQINTQRLAQLNPRRLVVDIVLCDGSNSYHLERATQYHRNLYLVPQTHRAERGPVDMHISYHADGRMWNKLTRGRLMIYPGGRTLGEAQPHSRRRMRPLWERAAQPWDALKGVERIAPHQTGVRAFVTMAARAEGYPIYDCRDADHIFNIDANSYSHFGIEWMMVEAGNRVALKDAIREMDQFVAVKKAELFTDLSPWPAIILYVGREAGQLARGS